MAAFCTSLEENGPKDDANICLDCALAQYSFCTHCNQILCVDCCDTWGHTNEVNSNECSVCKVRYCPSCCRDHGLVKETYCYVCCERMCSSCRLESCKYDNDCWGCRKLIFDALLEEYNTQQALIDAQRMEIERLRRSNKNC